MIRKERFKVSQYFYWTVVSLSFFLGTASSEAQQESPGEERPFPHSFGPDIQDKEAAINQESKSQMDWKNQLNRIEVDKINQEAEAAIADIPKYVYDSKGHKHSNPDYESTVSAIREEANRKIQAMNNSLGKDLQAESLFAQKKIRDIGGTQDAYRSQLKMGQNESSRLTPTGTNLYVRNYIHYSGDPPASTFAVPRSSRLTPLLAPGMKSLSPRTTHLNLQNNHESSSSH